MFGAEHWFLRSQNQQEILHVFVTQPIRLHLVNSLSSYVNKTPRGVSVGCTALRIAFQGQDE